MVIVNDGSAKRVARTDGLRSRGGGVLSVQGSPSAKGAAIVAARPEASSFRAVRSLMRCIEALRTDHAIDLEAALLYLLIGYLNLEHAGVSATEPPLKKTNIASASGFAQIPKETARRKVNRLVEVGLVSRNGGLAVTDAAQWSAYARRMALSEADPAEARSR